MVKKSQTIQYGLTMSRFGQCFVATSNRGICQLEFITETALPTSIQRLQSRFPEASLIRSDSSANTIAQSLFIETAKHSTHLHGTPFQMDVWNALLKVAFGSTISYSELAAKAGHPMAHRAVGTAVGQNPIAYLVPCHRVIRADGSIGNYRWGTSTKQQIIAWENQSTIA